MVALGLIEIDDEVGVVFPDELLAKPGLGPDDTIHAIAGPDGSMTLTLAKPTLGQQAVAD